MSESSVASFGSRHSSVLVTPVDLICTDNVKCTVSVGIYMKCDMKCFSFSFVKMEDTSVNGRYPDRSLLAFRRFFVVDLDEISLVIVDIVVFLFLFSVRWSARKTKKVRR